MTDCRASTVRGNLALGYQAAGRTNKAIELHEQTFADMTRSLGPGHPNTLTARSNLALPYRMAGRTSEAVELHEQTVADMTQLLGADHPTTLTARENLDNIRSQTDQVRNK
jgi:hypothetical protein